MQENGHSFLMLMMEDVLEFYEEIAESYDAKVLQEKDYTAFQKIPSWLLSALEGISNPTLLDLGCGTGLGAFPFIKAKYRVTGIDISPKMLTVAKKLPFHHLICQSLESPLACPGLHFDGAQMLGVMEFIQNPLSLFQEVERVLKPQGLFALTVPQKLPPEVEKHLGILTHFLPAIEKAFHEAGFSILKQETFQGFIYKKKTVHYCGYLLQKVI